MGQLVEWPEVITEGKTFEECRQMLQDALREMIIAYRQQNKEIPIGRALLGGTPLRRGLIPFPIDNCSNNVGTDLSVQFLGTNKFVPMSKGDLCSFGLK